MSRVFTDSHAHLLMLAEREGQAALDAVVDAYGIASGAGIADDATRPRALVLDAGVEADDFSRRKAALGRFPFVRLAAGIWPDTDALADPASFVAALERQVSDPACAAVGECGLDYHWMNGTREAQASLFEAQIELARRHGKPLVVHSRKAHEDTLAIVRGAGVPVVIHCFGYGPTELREYLDAGCYVSFAGNVTYKGADELRAAAALAPPERLLLETDAPYMSPEPRRGRSCSPLDIVRTYDFVAGLRGTRPEELAELVFRNAEILFG